MFWHSVLPSLEFLTLIMMPSREVHVNKLNSRISEAHLQPPMRAKRWIFPGKTWK